MIKLDLTNGWQKVFAGCLILLVGAAVYFLLPVITSIFMGIIMLIGIAFLALNYQLIWTLAKDLSWKMTKFAISKDKVGWMYKYIDYLYAKNDKLKELLLQQTAVKERFKRKIVELNESIHNNVNLANKYKNDPNKATGLKLIESKLGTDEKYLKSYMEKFKLAELQNKKLNEMLELNTFNVEQFKYSLDAKAEEYELLKIQNKATDAARAIIDKNSQEYKLFCESKKQLENEFTSYIANIEQFEIEAKPLLEIGRMEQEGVIERGIQLIENYNKQKVVQKA